MGDASKLYDHMTNFVYCCRETRRVQITPFSPTVYLLTAIKTYANTLSVLRRIISIASVFKKHIKSH